MKKLLCVSSAAAMLVAIAGPAMAQNAVVITPGASNNWVQRQPTSFLGVDMAQVLPNNLGYVSVSGPGFNYSRGMGGGGELAAMLGATLALQPTTFTANAGLGWKQQLTRASNMAIAGNVMAGVTGIGSGTTGIGLTAGLPISLDVGLGHFVVQPQVNFPNLTAGTAGAGAGANLGLMTPLANNWQLLLAATPTLNFGGGFGLPVGAGARFSPTDTAHIDVTVGQLNVTPFSGSLGLVGLTGHIGF